VSGVRSGWVPGILTTDLPEIVLEPRDITRLQLVSRTFVNVGRDGMFWRSRCYLESSFLESVNRRRKSRSNSILLASLNGDDNGDITESSLRQAASLYRSDSSASIDGNGDYAYRMDYTSDAGDMDASMNAREAEEAKQRERVRMMANWDPSYPSERVCWYNEYVHRHAPVAISWFQLPLVHTNSAREPVEARGVAIYRPDNPHAADYSVDTILAVSPLDDGGVCIWDVAGTRGRRGAIVARSKPGILFIDGPAADNTRRSRRIDSGVVECVSVDSQCHRAYFAVQSRELTTSRVSHRR
jgi:hypothetical protein